MKKAKQNVMDQMRKQYAKQGVADIEFQVEMDYSLGNAPLPEDKLAEEIGKPGVYEALHAKIMKMINETALGSDNPKQYLDDLSIISGREYVGSSEILANYKKSPDNKYGEPDPAIYATHLEQERHAAHLEKERRAARKSDDQKKIRNIPKSKPKQA